MSDYERIVSRRMSLKHFRIKHEVRRDLATSTVIRMKECLDVTAEKSGLRGSKGLTAPFMSGYSEHLKTLNATVKLGILKGLHLQSTTGAALKNFGRKPIVDETPSTGHRIHRGFFKVPSCRHSI